MLAIGILNLSGFYLPSTLFSDDRAIQNAIHKIKNCPDFFASECMDLIRQADGGITQCEIYKNFQRTLEMKGAYI